MMQKYYATMVRRWHANPHMSDTVDPVGYHGGRMAVLCLHFWPDCDRNLLAACITHDLGEFASGDIPYGGDKTTANAVADKWSLDNDLSHHYLLGDARLHFLDRLDAYLWARHHKPHVVATEKDWQDQREYLLTFADERGLVLDI